MTHHPGSSKSVGTYTKDMEHLVQDGTRGQHICESPMVAAPVRVVVIGSEDFVRTQDRAATYW